MISHLGLSMMLLAASGPTAADRMPKPGSYGFNWLDPEKASCRKLTEEDLAEAGDGTVSPTAFGRDIESHAGTVSERVFGEFLESFAWKKTVRLGSL